MYTFQIWHIIMNYRNSRKMCALLVPEAQIKNARVGKLRRNWVASQLHLAKGAHQVKSRDLPFAAFGVARFPVFT